MRRMLQPRAVAHTELAGVRCRICLRGDETHPRTTARVVNPLVCDVSWVEGDYTGARWPGAVVGVSPLCCMCSERNKNDGDERSLVANLQSRATMANRLAFRQDPGECLCLLAFFSCTRSELWA